MQNTDATNTLKSQINLMVEPIMFIIGLVGLVALLSQI